MPFTSRYSAPCVVLSVNTSASFTPIVTLPFASLSASATKPKNIGTGLPTTPSTFARLLSKFKCTLFNIAISSNFGTTSNGDKILPVTIGNTGISFSLFSQVLCSFNVLSFACVSAYHTAPPPILNTTNLSCSINPKSPSFISIVSLKTICVNTSSLIM